ncbi:hypothetical protein BX600DRAFT_434015 [Xylariales sp. PMI_506]|nr:hypothetical protein BX600DRAFT_434015 [Xylariales sp. PMI_506]
MANSAASPLPVSVMPAQLGFLAIFNPTLGTTDETIDDQIVYYASVDTQDHGGRAVRRRHRGSRARPTEGLSQEERNERLRQIGLAQGMVEFSRGFADGQSVDTIDTEKSRVVLRELEPGWWILASIDLTRLPLPPRLGAAASSKAKDDASENVEYSSREVKPASLLLQEMLRAHSIFLLHHAASLSALFVRSKRSRFVTMLSRYWDLFLSTWNVMLHGNPACAVFGGIKIAASGELGVGVGEEDRGSGEREVLEGFVDRVEGLVDLVVAKFGEGDSGKAREDAKSDQPPTWLGSGEEVGAEDGAIFLGVGALSRHSLRDVTWWMEDLYTWGEDAYGVKDSPTSTRIKAKRARAKSIKQDSETQAQKGVEAKSSDEVTPPVQPQDAAPKGAPGPDGAGDTDKGSVNKLMNYIKLGYGTHWSLSGSGTSTPLETTAAVGDVDSPATDRPEAAARKSSQQTVHENAGHFLIGLRGDVEDTGSQDADDDGSDQGSRTLLRTLTVELESQGQNRPEADIAIDLGSGNHDLSDSQSADRKKADHVPTFDSQDRNKTVKMRVVVYVSKPFIYTFLFHNRTDSLAWDSLYRSLHYQLEPLRKPLAISTSYRPGRPDAGAASRHIFDLVWDPQSLTIHSTIPNIPDPLRFDKTLSETWSRVEALNTHTQILNTYLATRDSDNELERTCKTSRGWWVVWTRVLDVNDLSPAATDIEGATSPPHLPFEDSQGAEVTEASSSFTAFPDGTSNNAEARGGEGRLRGTKNKKKRPKVSKEILLIRRAGEVSGIAGMRARGASFSESSGGGGWTDGASRLAQGIGVDTKKYIEGLLMFGH